MTPKAWPNHLAPRAIRFAHRTSRFEETVDFYRELVGLPLIDVFNDSYGLDGAIFGLPDSSLTFELVRSEEPVPVDGHEQLVLYLTDVAARDDAVERMTRAHLSPAAQYEYWEAHGAVTYIDPDGRRVVFVPWVYSAPPRQ